MKNKAKTHQFKFDEYFLTNKRIGIVDNGEVKTIVELVRIGMIEITQALTKVFVKFYLNANENRPMLEFKLNRQKSSKEVDDLLSKLNSLIDLKQDFLEKCVRIVRKE